MAEQGRQNCPVAHALERIGRRRIEEFPRLGIAKRRSAAFVAIGGKPLDAIRRLASDRVVPAQIIEQGR